MSDANGSESTDPRQPRRRGGPRERVEAPVAVESAPIVTATSAPVRRAVSAAPAAPAPRDPTDFDGLRAIGDMDPAEVHAMMDAFPSSSTRGRFKAGQRIRGRVTSIGDQHVFLDVGGKADAALDRLEFGDVQLGDTVDAFVASTDGELRLTRAPSGSAAREMFAEAQTAKLPIEGKIVAVADSGWQITLADGIKAFCPASHTGANDVADVAHIGTSMPFLIHDLRGRDVVLSRRALVEADERAVATERLGSINVNDVVEGTVTKVMDFGAFVKLPTGVEGMVHISNMADRRIAHPSEVVKEGDVVKVRVLAIDVARRRVDLGMRQAIEMSAAPAPRQGREPSAPVIRGFGQFAALLKDVKVKK